MTMHLAQGATTLNLKFKAKKVTKKQQHWREQEWRKHNKWLKQKGFPAVTFDEYVAEITGTKKLDKKNFTPLQESTAYRRGSNVEYKSAGTGIGNAYAKESPKYTGTLVKGIATMHKSNAVPVIDQEQASDISKMRR